MKNTEFVYAVMCFHDNDDNDKLKTIDDVYSIHKTLAGAERQCAEVNKYRQNAKPNPEFKRGHMNSYKNYIKINKNKPASWFYVKQMKIS